MSIVALTELLEINTGGSAISVNNPLPVSPINVQTEFAEEFQSYDTTTVWEQSVASGDIVQLDGNAFGVSYLVISKDPLTASGVATTITTRSAFTGPLEVTGGVSLSQRVLGQEFALELVSTGTPVPAFVDLALSSIGSNGTTLYINTVLPHNLSVGDRIGIYGVTSDSRLNYPALVVSQVLSTTQVYATAGPAGTIPSLTVGPYNTQGFLYLRPSLGYAQEGMSEIFENATVTQASMYVRAGTDSSYPSGTASGNHSVTVGTTASVIPAATAYTYAFTPTNDYRFLLQSDKAQFYDSSADNVTQPSSRLGRTSVVPSLYNTYKYRIRCTNDEGLTVPVAKITTASKAGSTTATVNTASAHGLTTGDYVFIIGLRNGTDFVPLTSAVVVASTPTSTQFTLVYGGTSATVTSYGGFVARGNGGNLPAGFQGAGPGAAVQSATLTATELTLTSSGSFAVSVGDYVNVYGVRDTVSGADLGVDGVYKVASVATTTAVFLPIGDTVLPAAFASTNCGGAVIKRTDIRINYVRINQYLRERVEILNKSDTFSGVPVTVNGGTITTVSSGSISAFTPINTQVTDLSSTAVTTTATSAAITPTASGSSEFNVITSAVTGTNPTLDVVIQESDDAGTNWYDIYHFPRITAVGQYRSPLIPLTGNRIRYVRTVSGTSPSFTTVQNRLVVNTAQPQQRQFFDRTLVVNTISSVTPTFFTEGCTDINVFVSMGAVTTTAPVLVYEESPDSSLWVQVGADITTAASTQNLLQISNVQPRFSRIRVKTAGSGATLNYIMVKGVGN